MKFDEFLYSHLGEMGRFQKIQFILVCLPTIITSMHGLSWTFASVAVPFTCDDNDWKNNIGPDSEHSMCEIPNGQTCSSFSFHSSSTYSAMERWSIVCDRAWIKATVQASYYFGQLIGSAVCGVLGDKYGRKPVFLVSITIQILCGFSQAAAPYWPLYALARLCAGITHPGVTMIPVVIGMELVGPRHRKFASTVIAMFFAVGQILLGTLAMNIHDYRFIHIFITTPAILFMSYWILVSESARWLVSVRRFDEADKVLKRATKVNGVSLPSEWRTLLDDSDDAQKVTSHNIFDLIRTPAMRKRTLVCFFIWPVVSMVYYGLSMKSDILGGDLYVNFIMGGFIEMPAILIIHLTIDRIGRQPLLIGGYTLTGLCLLSNLVVPADAVPYISLAQLLLSKAAITATYTVLYAFSSELFPTTIRNTAMGFCSTFARIGAITASFITMWIVDEYGRHFMIIPFGILTVLAALAILLILPETMGKPLPESIQEIEEGAKGGHRETELKEVPSE